MWNKNRTFAKNIITEYELQGSANIGKTTQMGG